MDGDGTREGVNTMEDTPQDFVHRVVDICDYKGRLIWDDFALKNLLDMSKEIGPYSLENKLMLLMVIKKSLKEKCLRKSGFFLGWMKTNDPSKGKFLFDWFKFATENVLKKRTLVDFHDYAIGIMGHVVWVLDSQAMEVQLADVAEYWDLVDEENHDMILSCIGLDSSKRKRFRKLRSSLTKLRDHVEKMEKKKEEASKKRKRPEDDGSQQGSQQKRKRDHKDKDSGTTWGNVQEEDSDISSLSEVYEEQGQQHEMEMDGVESSKATSSSNTTKKKTKKESVKWADKSIPTTQSNKEEGKVDGKDVKAVEGTRDESVEKYKVLIYDEKANAYNTKESALSRSDFGQFAKYGGWGLSKVRFIESRKELLQQALGGTSSTSMHNPSEMLRVDIPCMNITVEWTTREKFQLISRDNDDDGKPKTKAMLEEDERESNEMESLVYNGSLFDKPGEKGLQRIDRKPHPYTITSLALAGCNIQRESDILDDYDLDFNDDHMDQSPEKDSGRLDKVTEDANDGSTGGSDELTRQTMAEAILSADDEATKIIFERFRGSGIAVYRQFVMQGFEDPDPDRPILHYLLEAGNLEKTTFLLIDVLELMEEGLLEAQELADLVTKKNAYGMTPLHLAAQSGNFDLVDWFVVFLEKILPGNNYHDALTSLNNDQQVPFSATSWKINEFLDKKRSEKFQTPTSPAPADSPKESGKPSSGKGKNKGNRKQQQQQQQKGPKPKVGAFGQVVTKPAVGLFGQAVPKKDEEKLPSPIVVTTAAAPQQQPTPLADKKPVPQIVQGDGKTLNKTIVPPHMDTGSEAASTGEVAKPRREPERSATPTMGAFGQPAESPKGSSGAPVVTSAFGQPVQQPKHDSSAGAFGQPRPEGTGKSWEAFGGKRKASASPKRHDNRRDGRSRTPPPQQHQRYQYGTSSYHDQYNSRGNTNDPYHYTRPPPANANDTSYGSGGYGQPRDDRWRGPPPSSSTSTSASTYGQPSDYNARYAASGYPPNSNRRDEPYNNNNGRGRQDPYYHHRPR